MTNVFSVYLHQFPTSQTVQIAANIAGRQHLLTSLNQYFITIYVILTLVSVCKLSSGQVKTAILASFTELILPSTSLLKTIP